MAHDQIYHDLIMPMLCWTTRLTEWLLNGCEMVRSHYKIGRVLKWLDTISLACLWFKKMINLSATSKLMPKHSEINPNWLLIWKLLDWSNLKNATDSLSSWLTMGHNVKYIYHQMIVQVPVYMLYSSLVSLPRMLHSSCDIVYTLS